MKKIIGILLTCAMLLGIAPSGFTSAEIKVAIDGEYVEFDVKPQIISGRTMVPLRAIFEALGAEVNWDKDTQTVLAMKDDITVTATIGSTKMYVDDKEKVIDIAPMIIDGRTMVPARFVAEAFGCYVDWDDSDNTVYIYENQGYEDIIDVQE